MLSIALWVLISFRTCSNRSSMTVVIFWQHITIDKTEANFVSSMAGTPCPPACPCPLGLFEFWREPEFWIWCNIDPSSRALFKTEFDWLMVEIMGEVGTPWIWGGDWGWWGWFWFSIFRWSSANSSRFSFKFTVEVELVEAAVESVDENLAGRQAVYKR